MPAWITSLLRELVPVPIAPSRSSTITSRPASAKARATARPTTPAPMTTVSIFSADTMRPILNEGPRGRMRYFGRKMANPERYEQQLVAGWQALERRDLRAAEEIARSALRDDCAQIEFMR